ncbi:RNase adapter RapZ [Psychrilyobacter piezotolerans]|uniref:RNase adapter RapZ n=2 Tax=Fusobacteriaceae TaxID=203492 RepID=A0ABX9KK27_9FUSO|nr:RNase adapter RapZ [Psychrilyobacter piezotolerans]RDE65211.1 RNase adapter RapZ [Psychrilyobacter sp. S5]REI42781.1 RNase adapter RapZ [Psychrilyobacter piezotolerans]
MSGAGKSTALNYFEDRGYMTIDNMPCFFIDGFKLSVYKERIKKIAIGMDIRSFESTDEFLELLESLKGKGVSYRILYLDAKDEVILNRYNLTRRYHPLEKSNSMIENISLERRMLSEIRELADIIIDTSDFTPKKMIENLKVRLEDEKIRDLVLTITTFGFKYGAPIDLDMMFDTRSLRNPYYVDELRPKNGNDSVVQEYVMNGSGSKEYLKKIEEMLEFLLPHFIKEGKTHLTVGIGCSGGKHRSVTIARKLYEYFSQKENIKVLLNHREQEKWNL